MDKVIPAYYACYLLRSTVRHQSLYVGSTPHPRRRLRQHNGVAAGGAVKTSRDTLRPWEMACLVSGFPSKIAALQFEWAWQNAHLTRHLPAEARLTQAKSTVRISPKTGRPRKRPATPRLSLTDRLANLHLLLRANSFERWPLHVTFYADDVYRVWSKWTSQQVEKLRPGISVSLDESARHAPTDDAFMVPKESAGIHAVDVTYRGLQPHFLKSKRILERAEWLECALCHEGISASGAGTLVCPHEGCDALSHIECLSSAFVSAECDTDALVPTTGACPGCGKKLQWIDLVKELSMRMRGVAQIDALFKVRGRKKAAIAPTGDNESEISDDGEVPERFETLSDIDNRFEIPESSDDEVLEPVVRVGPSPPAKVRRFDATTSRHELERVVEDSDWDDALVLT